MPDNNTDLSITCTNDQAAEHSRRAMDSYVARRKDVVDHLQQAMAADTECALAPTLLGLMLHGARHKGMSGKIGKLLDGAEQIARDVTMTERENHYLQALSAASECNLTGMADHLESIVLSGRNLSPQLRLLGLCQIGFQL